MKNAAVYIIIAFGLLHLYGVTNPILDHHGHRQSDTMEISRLFVEESDAGLFTPKVSWRDGYSGIVGSEFPFFNFLISRGFLLREYLLTGGKGIDLSTESFNNYPIYRIITPGNYVAIGRLLSTLFSIFGMWFFYKLMIKVQGPKVALYSLFALSCSMSWFYFSRNVQPDIPAVSFALGGLYLFTSYLDNEGFFKKKLYLLISSILFMLGGLMKAPVLLLLFPGVYFAIKKDKYKAFIKYDYVWFAIIILLPLFLWLKHAVMLSKTNGLPGYFFLGRSFAEGASQIFDWFFIYSFVKRIFQEYTSWALTPFFFYGIYKFKMIKEKWFYIAWAFGFFVYSFKAGEHIMVHDYYGIPLVPMLCAICGIGIDGLISKNSKFKYLFVAVVLIIPIHLSGVYKMQRLDLIPLEKELHGLVPYDARIAINGGHWPLHLYMSHRKGWTYDIGFAENRTFIEELKQKGLEYIVLTTGFNRKKINKIYKDKIILSKDKLMVIKL